MEERSSCAGLPASGSAPRRRECSPAVASQRLSILWRALHFRADRFQRLQPGLNQFSTPQTNPPAAIGGRLCAKRCASVRPTGGVRLTRAGRERTEFHISRKPAATSRDTDPVFLPTP